MKRTTLLSAIMILFTVGFGACGDASSPIPSPAPAPLAAQQPGQTAVSACGADLTEDWNTLAHGLETLRLQSEDLDQSFSDTHITADDLGRKVESLRNTNEELQNLASAFESNYSGVSCSAIQNGIQIVVDPDEGNQVLDQLQEMDQSLKQQEEALKNGTDNTEAVHYEQQVIKMQSTLTG